MLIETVVENTRNVSDIQEIILILGPYLHHIIRRKPFSRLV